MKTIGLIGGMSWESSLEYYRLINEFVKSNLGGLHSAKSIMYSVDFDEIEKLQHKNQWKKASRILVKAGIGLEKAGADLIILCTNTMHKVAGDIEKNVNIPFIHIADATAEKIKKNRVKTIGLLGTKFTMEEDFYKGRLEKKHQLQVIIPTSTERQVVHDIIYEELCLGKIKNSSKNKFLKIIHGLEKKGAEGIILGCTEITLLVQQKDTKTKLFDTTKIHAEFAALSAISDFTVGVE
ncbi:MAG: aspartate/glutamate racemase family protein [Oligoflexia bacterium]|nr:aspartate/glutamate racemase family protein [Oligoflexia bacterium]